MAPKTFIFIVTWFSEVIVVRVPLCQAISHEANEAYASGLTLLDVAFFFVKKASPNDKLNPCKV